MKTKKKKKTRANTRHAVLRSTLIPPKMKRRNGRTSGRKVRRMAVLLGGRTDDWTDGRTNGWADGQIHVKR